MTNPSITEPRSPMSRATNQPNQAVWRHREGHPDRSVRRCVWENLQKVARSKFQLKSLFNLSELRFTSTTFSTGEGLSQRILRHSGSLLGQRPGNCENRGRVGPLPLRGQQRWRKDCRLLGRRRAQVFGRAWRLCEEMHWSYWRVSKGESSGREQFQYPGYEWNWFWNNLQVSFRKKRKVSEKKLENWKMTFFLGQWTRLRNARRPSSGNAMTPRQRTW